MRPDHSHYCPECYEHWQCSNLEALCRLPDKQVCDPCASGETDFISWLDFVQMNEVRR